MAATELFPGVSEKPVCVFCASSPGHDPLYLEAARSVGDALAQAGIPVVYGGGIRGLMGAVASSALSVPSSRVHGILPRALSGRAAESTLAKVDPEAEARNRSMARTFGNGGEQDILEGKDGVLSKEGTGQKLLDGDGEMEGKFTTETVETMHERKTRMAELSTGGFIVLPGGYGTYEEAFEMTTWNQLKIHQRPVIILNVNGFYTPLEQMISNAVSAGFITPLNSSLLKFISLDSAKGEVEGKVDWGKKSLEALRGWKWEVGAGYDLSWGKGGK